MQCEVCRNETATKIFESIDGKKLRVCQRCYSQLAYDRRLIKEAYPFQYEEKKKILKRKRTSY